MSSSATRRLQKDFQQIQKDCPDGITACPHDGDIMTWDAVIFGPDDTPWEGGILKLSFKFTETYPNTAPTVKFVTKVFHPNVYTDGRICIDMLQNQWTPIYDVSSILTSLQSLLTDPNPSSAANLQAAQMYQDDRAQYNRMVQECVEQSLLEADDE